MQEYGSSNWRSCAGATTPVAGSVPGETQGWHGQYEVDMADKRKRKRVFHVKPWHTPTHTNLFAEAEDDGDGDVPKWNGGDGDAQPTIGDQLTEGQTTELQELLETYSDVLKNTPGRTTLTERASYRDEGCSTHSTSTVSATIRIQGQGTGGAEADARGGDHRTISE